MSIFRELAIKVEGLEGAEGSGCIYSIDNNSGKKYILTAHHCLTRVEEKRTFTMEEMKAINFIDISGEKLYATNIFVPENVEDDFAVIEVFTTGIYKSITVGNTKRNIDYILCGYPSYSKEELKACEVLEGHVLEDFEDTFTLQNYGGHLSDADGDAYDNTKGFSGSGIYSQIGEEYQLIGLLVKLRAGGIHGKLTGIKITRINEFLLNNGLPSLQPSELNGFEIYLSNILKDEEEKLISILNLQFNRGINEINPHYITQKLKDKIFLPYDNEGNILNKTLWEGWLRFLLYISLAKNEVLTKSNLNNHVFIENPTASKKHFYYTNEKQMRGLIRKLFDRDAYEIIQDKDIIFINSENFKGRRMLQYTEVQKIVNQIDSPFMLESDIDITNPHTLKRINIIHLGHLIDEIEDLLSKCLMENNTSIEIRKKCIGHLNKIFKSIEIIEEGRSDSNAIEA